jgi:hypothetical protein
LFKRSVLYVPYSAIADVAGNQVRLNVDVATVNNHDWVQRPRWIGVEPDKYRNLDTP